MIKEENFAKVLLTMGFNKSKNQNTYEKYFDNTNCYVIVDFDNKIFIYPENTYSIDELGTDNSKKPDGILINDRTTCNFSKNENFVVFECICRLLNQGYYPKDIEIEPRWQLGRDGKSGKADIWIRNYHTWLEQDSLLIIECKTSTDGKKSEFEKEWNNMVRSEENQLFSYFQQRPDTKYLCLYTCDFINDKLKPEYYLINVQDNKEFLKQSNKNNKIKFKGFEEADSEKQKWKVWKNTYAGEFATKGLFENTAAYHIGKDKYGFEDLEPISSDDISKKFHKYATILRQHTVSNRENAFNKLSNLFLCKVVDELLLSNKKQNELKFYWKGKQYDNPFDLLDRLQKLYAEGMKEFLKDDVTYVEQKEIDDAFNLRLKGKAKERIDGLFKKLKYFSNNDFAFIDVYNEDLFYDNFKILLQVILMLQDIYITKSENNQFLGDFYELFLGDGVHQSEGQYFTPTPITNFMVRSLPKRSKGKVLDFACGAGHFLTEYAKFNDKNTLSLTGIDKDNRLSKLTKVASFMYGQDMDIIYADALGDLSKYGVEDHSFDYIITNPPFSVKGFLDTLQQHERDKFKLTKYVDKKSFLTNNSIECFFVERASQLLDKDGVLGIVLPYGVLNNGDLYIHMRKILLREFKITSIVSLNKITFGTTGTQAIILFAVRREFSNTGETNFCITDHYDDLIDQFIKGESIEKIDEEYENAVLLRQEYCDFIGYDKNEFDMLISRQLQDKAKISELEWFEEYRTLYTNIVEKEKEQYKLKCEKEKNAWSRRNKQYKEEHPWVEHNPFKPSLSFEQFVLPIEMEKFRYWLYTHDSNVLVIKSPEEKVNGKSNKSAVTSFLGYEWKSRKGSEGIHYISQAPENNDDDLDEEEKDAISNINSINYIQTPLYNPLNLDDSEKLNYLVRKHFIGEEYEIPKCYSDPSGKNAFATRMKLTDMLDFEKTNFDCNISLGEKNKLVKFQSHYELKSINKISKKVFAGGDKPENFVVEKDSMHTVPVVGNGSGNEGVLGYTDVARVSEKCLTVAARGTIGYTVLREKPFLPIVRLIVIIVDENECKTEYLSYFLKTFNVGNTGSVIPQLTVPYMKKIKVPVPPDTVQEIVIGKCKKIENTYNETRMTEDDYRFKLKEVFFALKIVIE